MFAWLILAIIIILFCYFAFAVKMKTHKVKATVWSFGIGITMSFMVMLAAGFIAGIFISDTGNYIVLQDKASATLSKSDVQTSFIYSTDDQYHDVWRIPAWNIIGNDFLTVPLMTHDFRRIEEPRPAGDKHFFNQKGVSQARPVGTK